jgi:hypothetical protein
MERARRNRCSRCPTDPARQLTAGADKPLGLVGHKGSLNGYVLGLLYVRPNLLPPVLSGSTGLIGHLDDRENRVKRCCRGNHDAPTKCLWIRPKIPLLQPTSGCPCRETS